MYTKYFSLDFAGPCRISYVEYGKWFIRIRLRRLYLRIGPLR